MMTLPPSVSFLEMPLSHFTPDILPASLQATCMQSDRSLQRRFIRCLILPRQEWLPIPLFGSLKTAPLRRTAR